MDLTPRDFANVTHLWELLGEDKCSPRLYARFYAWCTLPLHGASED